MELSVEEDQDVLVHADGEEDATAGGADAKSTTANRIVDGQGTSW